MGLFGRLLGGADARRRVDELQKRLKANPSNVGCALELADALAGTGQAKSAIRLLTELGPVLEKKGQFLGAIAVYKKVVEVDPASELPGTAASRKELRRLEEAASSRTLPAVAPHGVSAAVPGDGAQQKRDAIHPLLEAIPLFKDVPIHLVDQLIEKIHLRTFDAGVTIFAEGAPGSSLLFVVTGEVKVSGKDENGAEVPLRTLGPGDVAGEMSFLSSLPRSATLRTKAPTVLLELERRAVDPLVRKSPKLKDALANLYRERVLNDVLVRSSLFGTLPARVRDSIAGLLVPITVSAGDTVRREGDRPEALYLIAQGLVRITGVDDGKEVERAILSPPSFFGNLGRRREEGRTAVATAVTDLELFTLDPNDLAPLLASYPAIWAALDEIQLEQFGSRPESRAGAAS